MKDVQVKISKDIVKELKDHYNIDANAEINRAVGKERINALIEEATDEILSRDFQTGLPTASYSFNKEKFAELIIRECISVCNDGDSQYFISAHFGLKE